jgi:ataxin 2/2L
VPHRYQNGAEDKKINVDTVQDNLIIKLEDIVTIEAKDVDLDYVTRDTFATDTAIASRSNGPNREKELQPWLDLDGPGSMNGGDMSAVTLELDTKTNGWDANEMFQLNEKEHGIKTTYKDNLESYTVQIERKDTQDYRRQELEAERIANEIENNPKTQERLEVENGDEEAAFAAVIRPEDSNNSSSTNSNSNNSNTSMNSAAGNSDKSKFCIFSSLFCLRNQLFALSL